jgi:hypothetical protein
MCRVYLTLFVFIFSGKGSSEEVGEYKKRS